jgi:hypothetical protein
VSRLPLSNIPRAMRCLVSAALRGSRSPRSSGVRSFALARCAAYPLPTSRRLVERRSLLVHSCCCRCAAVLMFLPWLLYIVFYSIGVNTNASERPGPHRTHPAPSLFAHLPAHSLPLRAAACSPRCSCQAVFATPRIVFPALLLAFLPRRHSLCLPSYSHCVPCSLCHIGWPFYVSGPAGIALIIIGTMYRQRLRSVANFLPRTAQSTRIVCRAGRLAACHA